MKNLITLLGYFCAIVLIMCFFVASIFGLGTQHDHSIRVLEQQGYTQIEITGWRPFMRSEKDVYSTGFKAKSPSGHDVTGAVTSGLFKGTTIRLD